MFCDLHGSGPCLCDLESNAIPNYIDYSYHDIDECECDYDAEMEIYPIQTTRRVCGNALSEALFPHKESWLKGKKPWLKK